MFFKASLQVVVITLLAVFATAFPLSYVVHGLSILTLVGLIVVTVSALGMASAAPTYRRAAIL